MKHLKQKLALITCFVTLCATLTSCANKTDSNSTEISQQTGSAQTTVKDGVDVEVQVESNSDFLVEGTTLVRYLGNERVVEVPDYITEISDFAFEGFNYTSNFLSQDFLPFVRDDEIIDSVKGSNITKIILPETVTKIGGGAFYNCTLLTEINIPESVTEIGAYAFNNCYSLTSIELPPNLTELRPYLFNNCIFLRDVTMHNNITSIGEYAFNGCASIIELEIPNSVKTIGTGAFSECVYMERIVLPDGLTHILVNTFSNCKSIQEINLPDSVIYVADGVFFNVGRYSGEEFNYDIFGKPLSDNLKYFGTQGYLDSVYYYSTESYGEFSEDLLPQTIETTEIIDGFEILDGLLVKYHGEEEVVVIPDTVKAISENAFRNGKSIKEITLPNTIVIIRPNTFSNLTSLTTVNLPDSCKVIEKNAFKNCTALTEITIPNANFIMNEVFNGCTALENIIIPTEMTTIPSRLFEEWNFNGEFIIPDHVTTIEEKAFVNSTGLTNITIPDSVTHIETHAFYNCENLEQATISNNLETMEINAFSNCNFLKEITIPKSVENIIDDFFQNCYNIYKVNVNEEYDNQIQIIENKNYIYHDFLQELVDNNGLLLKDINISYDDSDALVNFMFYDINDDGSNELILITANSLNGRTISIYNSSLEMIYQEDNVIYLITANTGNIYIGTGAITNEEQYRAFYDGELDDVYWKGNSFYGDYSNIITHTHSSSNTSSRLGNSLRNFFGLLISDKFDNTSPSQSLSLYENTTQFENCDYLNLDYSKEKQKIEDANKLLYNKYSNIAQHIVDNIGILSQTSQGEGVYDVVLADLDEDEIDELILIYKIGEKDIEHAIYYNDLQGNVYTAQHFDEYTTQGLITKLGLKTQTDAESIKYYNENLLNILEVQQRELWSNYSETPKIVDYSVPLNELNLSPEVAKKYIDYLKEFSKEYNLDESLIEFFMVDTNSAPIIVLELLSNDSDESQHYYGDIFVNQTMYYNNNSFSNLYDTMTDLCSEEQYWNVMAISEVNGKTYISFYKSKMEPEPKIVLSYFTLINGQVQKEFSLYQYDFHYKINSDTNNGVSYFDYGYSDEYDDFYSEGFNYKKIGELGYNNFSITSSIPNIYNPDDDTPYFYTNYGDSFHLLLNEYGEHTDIIYTAESQNLYWRASGSTMFGNIINNYTINEAINQLEKML